MRNLKPKSTISNFYDSEHSTSHDSFLKYAPNNQLAISIQEDLKEINPSQYNLIIENLQSKEDEIFNHINEFIHPATIYTNLLESCPDTINDIGLQLISSFDTIAFNVAAEFPPETFIEYFSYKKI